MISHFLVYLLVDSVKLFYTVSAYQLNSKIKYLLNYFFNFNIILLIDSYNKKKINRVSYILRHKF